MTDRSLYEAHIGFSEARKQIYRIQRIWHELDLKYNLIHNIIAALADFHKHLTDFIEGREPDLEEEEEEESDNHTWLKDVYE